MGVAPSSEPKPKGAEKNVILPIRPRLYWTTGEGYAAEGCIQSTGLYYGYYFSQEICRLVNGNRAVFPGSKDQGVANVLEKLGMSYELWDETQTPLTSAFLGWAKKQIFSGHPVIMCVYQPKGRYKEYDHSVLMTGIRTCNGIKNLADQSDVVLFNDGIDQMVQERQICTLCDDRSMRNNGYSYGYCLPNDIQNYGVAITGVRDTTKFTVPVRIEIIGSNSEPNYTTETRLRQSAQRSTLLELVITMYDLHIGLKYALYKSTEYKSCSFEGEGKQPFKEFVLDKNNCRSTLESGKLEYNYSIVDTVSSDAFVCYRCLVVTKQQN